MSALAGVVRSRGLTRRCNAPSTSDVRAGPWPCAQALSFLGPQSTNKAQPESGMIVRWGRGSAGRTRLPQLVRARCEHLCRPGRRWATRTIRLRLHRVRGEPSLVHNIALRGRDCQAHRNGGPVLDQVGTDNHPVLTSILTDVQAVACLLHTRPHQQNLAPMSTEHIAELEYDSRDRTNVCAYSGIPAASGQEHEPSNDRDPVRCR
jgi:hypothetical protein